MRNGTNVWYILTDVDDADVAAELGLNFSAKMTFMANAARTANLDQNGDLVFDKGTVDFSPVRSITPGPPALNSLRPRPSPEQSAIKTIARLFRS
jgi:hypothetical protein